MRRVEARSSSFSLTLDRRVLLGRSGVALVIAAVVGLTYWRLYYGIDFTDESFYVVLPYRLVLGARPFVDETSVTQQSAALLVYPLVRAYHAIAGATGIVLFVRHLQFLLSLLVATTVAVSLRRVLDGSRAALVAVAAVAFVPFDIHSLSYNTLASGLFTAGCLLGFNATKEPRGLTFAAAAACGGLAAFAYPPLAGAVAVVCVTWIALARGRRGYATSWALVALVLPVGGLAALFGSAGVHRVVADYRNSSRYLGQGGGLDKIAAAASHQWTTFRLWYLVLIALALLALTWRRRRAAAAVLLLLLPLLAWPPRAGFYTASLEYVAHYGWLALPLYPAVSRRPGAGALLVAVWLPALVAGSTTAYSSANGGVNFGIGFFPATIVTTVFLTWALEETGLPRWVSTAPALCVLGMLLFTSIPVYRDGTVNTLRARIHGGAYAGLLTSVRKRAFLTLLRRDLAGLGPRCRILFFNDFPAGYLLTDARPDTNGAWTATVAPADVASYQGALLRYYRRRGFPDVVVLMRRIPYGAPTSARIEHYRPGEPLLAALRQRRYRPIAVRLDYVVYLAANAPRCSSGASGATNRAPPSVSQPVRAARLSAARWVPRSGCCGGAGSRAGRGSRRGRAPSVAGRRRRRRAARRRATRERRRRGSAAAGARAPAPAAAAAG